jgi:hypothetical protein
MAARLIVGIVALACLTVCGFISSLAHMEMVDKVNGKLPPEQKFDLLGWYFAKTRRLHSQYRELFPEGRLLLRIRVYRSLCFVCVVICIWSFARFSGHAHLAPAPAGLPR